MYQPYLHQPQYQPYLGGSTTSFSPSGGTEAKPTVTGRGGFAFNGRAAAALLPTIISMTTYGGGGSNMAAVLVVGFMGAYILDGMRIREGSFAVVWATLIAGHLALMYDTFFSANEMPVVSSMLFLLLGGFTLFLVGVWATVQFAWIRLSYPAVVVAFEKLLLTATLPVCGTLLTWWSIELAGMGTAPYISVAILCSLYAMFVPPAVPAAASLAGGGGGGGVRSKPLHQTTSSSLDGFVSYLYVVSTPVALYSAAHWETLWSSSLHMWSCLLLTSIPTLITIVLLPQGSWWLGRSASADAVRVFTGLVALAAAIAGIEGRIIFHSFGQYIRLAAPWNYVAITIGLYGVGTLLVLHFTGIMGEEAAGVALGPVLMIGASVGGLVTGLPWYVLPGPLIAAAGLSLYYDSRSWKEYMLFVVSSLLTASWFVWHHFWHLDISLSGVPLRWVCCLLLSAMVPGLLVPGLILSGMFSRSSVVTMLLVSQAALLTVVEEVLFAGDHTLLTYDLHPVFPAALVVATSGVGVAMTRRLVSKGVIGEVGNYLLQCIYVTKIVMLAIPQARLTFPALGLALSITPPLLLESSSISGRTGPWKTRLRPWQGLGLACAVVLSTVAARFAVFDVLHTLTNRKPSEALAAGTLLIISSLGCVPLVFRYYRSVFWAKRTLLLVGALGVSLALLRPPLFVRGGAQCPHLPFGLCPRLWDEGHVPEHEQDDVAMYGDGIRRREHWAVWLLVAATFAGLWTLTSRVSVARAAPLRLSQAAVAALLVGGYMALDFFPGLRILQVITIVSALAVGAALVAVHGGTMASVLGALVVVPLWAASLPVSLLALKFVTLPPLPPESRRLVPEQPQVFEVEEERRMSLRLAIVASFAAQSLLLAFTFKLRVGRMQREVRRNHGETLVTATAFMPGVQDFLGRCLPPNMTIKSGGKTRHGHNEGVGAVAIACNLLTVMCYGSCLWINTTLSLDYYSLFGSAIGVLLIAPILLLLCQDPLFCRSLESERRYFVPVLVSAALLAASAGYVVGNTLLQGLVTVGGAGASVEPDVKTKIIAFALRNGGPLVMSIPSLLGALSLLWTGRGPVHGQPGGVLRYRGVHIITGIVASVGVIIAQLDSVRILCAAAGIGALVLLGSAQHTRAAGRKLL